MKVKFFLLAFFSVLTSEAQQWEQIHPQHSLTRFIHHARVSDNGTEWIAIGNDIVISNDKGVTWTTVPATNFPFVFKPDMKYVDISFVKNDVGFMVFQSSIYKTINGGASWFDVLTLQPSNEKYPYSAYFHSIAFVSEEEGYAVGDFKKIFHTTDGGNNWEEISWTGVTAPFIAYTDVAIGDNNELYVGGYEVSDILMNFGFDEFVMFSTDNGVHWERNSIPTGGDFRNIDVHVVDAGAYFVNASRTQGTEQIFYTANDGKQWAERTPAEMRLIRTLECLPGGVLLAWGENYQYQSVFYRSQDFGESWSKISLPIFPQQDDFAITDIVFENSMNGFAVGAGGNILTTQDEGKSWQQRIIGFPAFLSIDMADENTGFASAGSGFFKTVDGGSSWNFMPASDSLTILNMTFESASRGLFFGWKNGYYNVLQQGTVVDKIDLPVNIISLSAALQKGDSLFVSGGAGGPTRNVFLRSADRGESWSVTDIPSTNGLVYQLQRSQNYFYAATSQGIRRSNSNGSEWTSLSDFNQEYLEAMLVLDDQVIIAFFSSGSVKRSLNHGQTWLPVGNFSHTTMVKDFVLIKEVIFAYGLEIHGDASFGALWRSDDRGASWTKETLPLIDNMISDMDAAGNSLYATGGYGMIFKFDMEKSVTGVEGDVYKGHVGIFPVPAAEELFLEMDDGDILECALVDVTGGSTRLTIENFSENRWRADIDSVSPGAYIVRVRTSKGVFRRRIVVL